MTGGRDWVDASMLELFRDDAKVQVGVFETGLSALKDGSQDPEIVAQSMNAARALEGSARLVDLEPAARLAAALKDFLSAQTSFNEKALEIYARVVAAIKKLAETPPEEFFDYLDENAGLYEGLIAELAEKLEPKITQTPEPAGPAAPIIELDSTMLELFQQDAGAQVDMMTDALNRLASEPESGEVLEALKDAAGSLNGVARLVGLEPIARTAAAMEAALAAGTSVGPEPAAIMGEAVSLFREMIRVPVDRVPVFLAENQAVMTELEKKLAELQTRKPAAAPRTPAAPKSTPKPIPAPPDADLSMLDLFCGEARTHSASLETGLVALEAATATASAIEPLMRAAHSIKGAARIVGLDAAVSLAHVMEDVLVAAQEGRLTLSPESVDLLLAGTDIFKSLGEASAAEVSGVLAEQAGAASALEQDLTALLGGSGAPAKAAAVPPPKPESEPKPAPPDADLSMLDLFCGEARTHSASLETGLVALEADTATASAIEPLMRAAHSIKGAARIVGLDAAVSLAHVMEDVLVAAQEGRLTLSPESVDLLLAGTDIFKSLGEVQPVELDSWLEQESARLAGLEKSLHGVLSGRPEQPAPTPVATLAPPPPAAESPAARTPAKADSSVLVTAENLSRLIGLASECLVQAGRLEAFAKDLSMIKSNHRRLQTTLARLKTDMEGASAAGRTDEIFSQVMEIEDDSLRKLADHLEEFETFWLNWEQLVGRLYNETLAVRMRPFKDGCQGFPRLVRDAARKLSKKIQLTITGRETKVDRDILSRLDAPLNHVLRNACDHGIESPEARLAAGKPEEGSIHLDASHRAGMLTVTVSDDGGGIDPERLRQKVLDKGLGLPDMVARLSDAELYEFLFVPGFSTAGAVTEISGRGVGLDVVRNMLEEVGGSIRLQSDKGRGSTFELRLPLTRSVLRTLLVEVGGEAYAFPLTRVDLVEKVLADDIQSEDGLHYYVKDDRLPVMDLGRVLGFETDRPEVAPRSLVVIGDKETRYGLTVDRLLGERSLVIRPLDPRLGKVPAITAAAVLNDGRPVLILDVDDLVRIADHLQAGQDPLGVSLARELAIRIGLKALVVDDSETVRQAIIRILEDHGYLVDQAVDGREGLDAARAGNFDLIVTDVDMPRMNGLDLVAEIRRDRTLKDMPVIMVSYKDRPEDRAAGLAAGADRYLAKGDLNAKTLTRLAAELIEGSLVEE